MKGSIAVIHIVLAFLLSCREETDFFYENNKAPEIFLRTTGKQYGTQAGLDSMKASVGFIQYNYRILDEHPECVKVYFSSNFNTSEFTWVDDSTFIYRSAICGEHQIGVTAEDPYGKITRATSNIICFDNMPPVALLKYKIQGNEILLDGSQSYDGDARYGGRIKTYEFFLCGDTYRDTTDGKINVGVDTNKEISFGLRVYDNDNSWDETQPFIIGGNR